MLINKYGEYLRKTFGQSIYKITVDAGFSCPNRDGTKGVGGCTYCNNEKFFQADGASVKSVREQVIEKIARKKQRKPGKYIVYFQTYSNTYSSTEYLRTLYTSVLDIEDVIGIAIGTRTDCVDDEKLQMLHEISKTHYVCMEYGLESILDDTLLRINRGHDINCFVQAVKNTEKYGIDVCAHLIFGFPWENRDIAKKSAVFINELPIKFIKIHQLQVVKNSIMGNDYKKSPFSLIDKTEYVDYLMDFLTNLRPNIVIQRVAGDCPPDILLASGFAENSHKLLNDLEKKLIDSNLKQGCYVQG